MSGNNKAASWEAGALQVHELPVATSGIIVPNELELYAFSRHSPISISLILQTARVRSVPTPLQGELAHKLDGQDFSTSPFRGLAAKGRLFVLGNIRPSDDHLPVTSVIADRVGAELDRAIFRIAQHEMLRCASAPISCATCMTACFRA